MQPHADLLIRKARVIDPATGRDEIADLLIEDGRLSRIGASLDAPGAELFDADGLWLIPGLVDTCVRLPEPASGRTGTLASETRAAAAGGITHMAALPDTDPVADNPAVVRLIRERAIKAGLARVMPIAAMTQGLAGSQLSEMQTLKEMGCIAVSNAGYPVQDTLILKRCLEYAATFNLLVIFRPQDAALSAGGCAHEGPVSTRLGLPGIPAVAETIDMARILLLVAETGVRAHFHQLSCADSVALLRDARARGLPVTADTSIHHLLLDQHAVAGFNSLCHINPPLRRSEDRDALLAAVADGTLDAICSQHTPLGASAKLAPFPATSAGISGLDTLLSLTLKLVEDGQLPLMRALDALTQAPARCLGVPAGNLEYGRLASLCVVDGAARRVPGEGWHSAGRNSPWLETSLPGATRLTVCEGKIAWQSV